MVTKLLSASLLCLLCGASSVIFGMETDNKSLMPHHIKNPVLLMAYGKDNCAIIDQYGNLEPLKNTCSLSDDIKIYTLEYQRKDAHLPSIPCTLNQKSTPFLPITLTIQAEQLQKLRKDLQQQTRFINQTAKAYVVDPDDNNDSNAFMRIWNIKELENSDDQINFDEIFNNEQEPTTTNSSTKSKEIISPKTKQYPLITNALCNVFNESHNHNCVDVKKTSQICFTSVSANDIIDLLTNYIPKDLRTNVSKDSAACINEEISYIQLIQWNTETNRTAWNICSFKQNIDTTVTRNPMINVVFINNMSDIKSLNINAHIKNPIPVLFIIQESLKPFIDAVNNPQNLINPTLQEISTIIQDLVKKDLEYSVVINNDFFNQQNRQKVRNTNILSKIHFIPSDLYVETIEQYLKNYIPNSLINDVSNIFTDNKSTFIHAKDESWKPFIINSYLRLIKRNNNSFTTIYTNNEHHTNPDVSPMIDIFMVQNDNGINGLSDIVTQSNRSALILIPEKLKDSDEVQKLQKAIQQKNSPQLTDNEIKGLTTDHTLIKTNQNLPKKSTLSQWFFKNPKRNGLVLGVLTIGITAYIAAYLTGNLNPLTKFLLLPVSMMRPLLTRLRSS